MLKFDIKIRNFRETILLLQIRPHVRTELRQEGVSRERSHQGIATDKREDP